MKYILLLIAILLCSASFAAGYKHDSAKHVEITSDMLEVFQLKQEAMFSGNVKAKQDKVTINSDTMVVHYNMQKNKFGKTKSSISKVNAQGHVLLLTPTDKATGDKGIFDVNKKLITLLGNVSLESGKNMVKGEKFVYNLNTGQSSIVSGEKPVDDTGKKGRVKGVFTPDG